MIESVADSGRDASLSRRAERSLDAVLRAGRRIPPLQAWMVVALGVGLTGAADASTGTQMWFGPVYLLVICAASWSLGSIAGVATGIFCAALAQGLNGVSFYPLGGALLIWDVAMRFLAVFIIVALIGSVRRSHDREWQRARSDALTGLHNRHGFFDILAERPKRRQWSLLFYIDLDGFKQINDRHGHAAGDSALQNFANAMRQVIRGGDILARIGGDEFLVLMHAPDEQGATRLARSLHARIGQLQKDRACTLSCSIGVLLRGPDAGQVTEAQVEMADRLMYQAKLAGSGFRIAKLDSRLNPSDVLAGIDESHTALAA